MRSASGAPADRWRDPPVVSGRCEQARRSRFLPAREVALRVAPFDLKGAARLLAASCIVSFAGCASVTDTLKSARDAVLPSSASTTAAKDATPARPAPEAPVAPALKASYDNALALMKAGRNAEAERALRQIADANPELGGPHANLGLLLRKAGKPAEATAEFEAATRLNPRQPVYWNQLGVSYRQQGRLADAKTAYEKAIGLDAGYAAPVLNLGILHDLYLGDGAKALDLYTRYLAMSGGDATVTKWVADLKNRKAQPITVSSAAGATAAATGPRAKEIE